MRSILHFGYRTAKRPPRNRLCRVAGMRSELNRLLLEVAHLGAGGELSETIAADLSPDERVVFEIALIDTLTRGTSEQQRNLRRALIKGGYDEQCARRAMREAIADRVRASTLLTLLHPGSRTRKGAQSKVAVRNK